MEDIILNRHTYVVELNGLMVWEKNTSEIEINVREYRRANQIWTIQRNGHHNMY